MFLMPGILVCLAVLQPLLALSLQKSPSLALEDKLTNHLLPRFPTLMWQSY